ncbi:MAG: carbamoyltransferase [Polyangiales bacterium]|jgi:carbamoyltransferase
MAVVLGISAYYHDAAAALVVDGHILAAQQEERLSRIKNDSSLPRGAIDACLALGGIKRGELDRVVFYENPYRKLERVLVGSLSAFPRGARFFRRALRSQLGEKLWVLDALSDYCEVDRKSVHFVDHHESHAASALWCAPFDDAVALTVDGVGEEETTAIWTMAEGRPKRVASLGHPHSLGLFYAAITAYLGFRVNEGEFKVMGLAAFGEPRFAAEMAALLKPMEAGSFALNARAFGDHLDVDKAFGPEFIRRLGKPRDPGREWNLDDTEDKRFADVAASAQLALEEAMLRLARQAQERSGARHLALAGGVALNCRANARLLAETEFERVFVQPAAGDAGGALGAALLGASDEGDDVSGAWRAFVPGLGVAADPSKAMQVARHLGLQAERVADPHAECAERLHAGEIVAWVSGRAEWGPRALGHRSLLTRADDPALRDTLNRRIKGREAFRPFAPVMLEAAAGPLVDGAPNDMTPSMTTTCNVVDRRALAACTHIDGTARVQTVGAGGALEGLLNAASKRGMPALLNTSLNAAGEPLVAHVTDALDFFMRRKPDALFVEDVLITREPRP